LIWSAFVIFDPYNDTLLSERFDQIAERFVHLSDRND